jgi:hypothetical protein
MQRRLLTVSTLSARKFAVSVTIQGSPNFLKEIILKAGTGFAPVIKTIFVKYVSNLIQKLYHHTCTSL